MQGLHARVASLQWLHAGVMYTRVVCAGVCMQGLMHKWHKMYFEYMSKGMHLSTCLSLGKG